jgi:hypothetical protein
MSSEVGLKTRAPISPWRVGIRTVAGAAIGLVANSTSGGSSRRRFIAG